MELKVRLGNMTGDVQKDLKTLSSFVFQQSEELRYLLHNLDVTNFNDLGLMRYENGRLQVYTEKLNLKAKELKAEFEAADKAMKTTIEGTINGLKIEVEQEIEGLGKQISTVEQTANGLKSTVAANTNSINEINNTKIPGIQGQISTISQTAGQIQTTVNAHTTSINNINNTTIPALQSQITQQANNISLVVNQNGIKAAEIVAAINKAGSSVQISADHVNITGFVTFTDLSTKGSTVIDAGNISTGTMEGVVIRSAGNWNVEIYRGSIYFGNYGYLAEHDDAILTFDTGNTYRFYLPSGRYWELSGSGMNYYTASGGYINGFQFAN